MLSIPEHDGRAIGATTAIQRGDVDALQRLLCEDPNLAAARVVDGRGVSRTLLHIVADWPGHFPNGPRTVSMLVAAGADINAHVQQPAGPHPSNETALHWAASSDDVAVIDALLDGGADIEAPGAVFTGVPRCLMRLCLPSGGPHAGFLSGGQRRPSGRPLPSDSRTAFGRSGRLNQPQRWKPSRTPSGMRVEAARSPRRSTCSSGVLT
jgi:hypothetical protein